MVQGVLGQSLNPRIINELATADIVVHYPMHEPKRGRAAVTKFMTEFREAFPDLNFWGVGDLVAEGDLVVGRWEGGGTHTGPAFSDFRLGSLPAASGRQMRFTGTTVLRVQEDGSPKSSDRRTRSPPCLQLGLIRLPEHAGPAARPGGELPAGWNNMSGYPEDRAEHGRIPRLDRRSHPPLPNALAARSGMPIDRPGELEGL